MHFTGTKIFALDVAIVEAQNMLSSHGGFLTIIMCRQREQYNQITHYDETEIRAHDSHKFRAKENLKLSHGGPSYSQASGTSPLIKALRQRRH